MLLKESELSELKLSVAKLSKLLQKVANRMCSVSQRKSAEQPVKIMSLERPVHYCKRERERERERACHRERESKLEAVSIVLFSFGG